VTHDEASTVEVPLASPADGVLAPRMAVAPGDASAPGDLWARSQRAPLSHSEFELAYTQVVQRVQSALQRKGVHPQEVEDVTAEALTTALAQRVAVRNVNELTGWVLTVAWRRYVDGLRHEQCVNRRIPYERAVTYDTTTAAAFARVDWDAVVRTIATWNETDREVILANLLDGESMPVRGRTSGWTAVRRFRLRARLLSLFIDD
jgi:DNA-directed RNA polymerase specialized sigma24 family protein